MKPPMSGKSHMFSAVVKMKSSFPPNWNNGEERQQIPKSFYSFHRRHIPTTLPIENIGFVVTWMADLKGKKVFVTGGAGFIGYHLCNKLSTLTDDLTIYDNLSSGKMENVKDNPKAKFVKGDILDVKKLCSQPKARLDLSFSCTSSCSLLDGESIDRF